MDRIEQELDKLPDSVEGNSPESPTAVNFEDRGKVALFRA